MPGQRLPLHCGDHWDHIRFASGPANTWVEVPLAAGVYICRVRRFYNNDGYITGAPRGMTDAEIEARFATGTWGGIHLEEDASGDSPEILIEVTIEHTVYVRGTTQDQADFSFVPYESPNLIPAASGDGRRFNAHARALR